MYRGEYHIMLWSDTVIVIHEINKLMIESTPLSVLLKNLHSMFSKWMQHTK